MNEMLELLRTIARDVAEVKKILGVMDADLAQLQADVAGLVEKGEGGYSK